MTKRTKSSRRRLSRARSVQAGGDSAHRQDHSSRLTIVDLGAAPGGWNQYAAKVRKRQGRILAPDILAIDAILGVEFLQGDFSADDVFAKRLETLSADRPQLVMSDMAPNMSGIAEVDHARGMYLVELSLDFAEKVLAPGAITWSRSSKVATI